LLPDRNSYDPGYRSLRTQHLIIAADYSLLLIILLVLLLRSI